MLELIAMKVEKTQSGYTERPFPAGQISGTEEELDAFVDFLKVNMIALPVYENNKVNLVFNSDYPFIMGLSNSFWDKTWVSIDEEGMVLVHLAKKDYLLYKEEYSYDQLCESMGSTIIHFFELFMKEEEQRIIDQLNDLNINVITEA